MIGTIISLILIVIVLGVLFWAAQRLLPLIPLAEPFHTILSVLLVLLGVFVTLYVLIMILNSAGVHVPPLFGWGGKT